MKKLMALVMVLMALTMGAAQAEVYATAGVVTWIEGDVVEVTQANGNVWEFEGAEDWMVGDLCAMLMEDNETEKIFDDEIVSTQYCGWIDEAQFEAWFEG